MYWDVNNFYESAMSQILHVDRFWIGKIASNFDEYFIKTCVENSGKA